MAGVALPKDTISTKFPTIASVINEVLPYVYTLAGLALLVMLVMGGITLMTAAGDQGKTKQGSAMIANAFIGFFLVFISYFVVQIVEIILGAKIL